MAIDTQARTEVKHYKNYIGGEWVDAASGETFDVINPATEEVFATVPSGGREDAQRAIAAAREAFDSGVWSGHGGRGAQAHPAVGGRALRRGRGRAGDARDDAGRHDDPRHQHGRDRLLHQHWDYFARQATRPMQEALEPVTYPTHSYNFVLREPVGVCAGIIPWNFPLVMAVWKLAPALAMGNTCVLKPASNTPLTALKLAEILDDTDLPKGVVNVITGGGVDGRRGARLAPRRRQGRVHRLDGGRAADHAARLEHDQEDDARAGRQVAQHRVRRRRHGRRRWTARCGRRSSTRARSASPGTRLLLPESIHDEFVERLVERAKQIKVGDTMDYESDLGPLVSAAAARDGRELRADRQGGGREARARRQAARRATATSAATGSSRRSSPRSTTR